MRAINYSARLQTYEDVAALSERPSFLEISAMLHAHLADRWPRLDVRPLSIGLAPCLEIRAQQALFLIGQAGRYFWIGVRFKPDANAGDYSLHKCLTRDALIPLLDELIELGESYES